MILLHDLCPARKIIGRRVDGATITAPSSATPQHFHPPDHSYPVLHGRHVQGWTSSWCRSGRWYFCYYRMHPIHTNICCSRPFFSSFQSSSSFFAVAIASSKSERNSAIKSCSSAQGNSNVSPWTICADRFPWPPCK